MFVCVFVYAHACVCVRTFLVCFCLITNVILSHLHNIVNLDNFIIFFHVCVCCEYLSLPSGNLSSLAENVAFKGKKRPHQLVLEQRLFRVRADRQITAADTIQLAEATVNYNDTKSRQCGGVAD